MLSKLRPHVKPFVEAIATPLNFLHPNIITVIGLLGSIAFAIAMDQKELGLAGFALFISLFDMFDGAVARMTGKVSEFGGFFDSTIDRISDAFLIYAFAMYGAISWELATFAFIASIMISYSRARAEAAFEDNSKLDVGILERPERVLMIFFAYFTLQFEIAILNYSPSQFVELIFWIITVLGTITLLQRCWAAYLRLR